jgi:hypothetical protein
MRVAGMFHAAHQMARLKHAPDMNEAVEQASEQARGADDPVAAGKVANELRRRHQWVMNPKSGAPAVAATQLGFLYFLGATPAAGRITGDTIERSMRARQSTTRRMESGIIVTDPELNRDINRLMGAP